MKQFLKPFILEWKHAAQRKCFNLNEIKLKNPLLENKTLPPSNSASNRVYSLTFTAVTDFAIHQKKKPQTNQPKKHPTNHQKQLNKTTPLTQTLSHSKDKWFYENWGTELSEDRCLQAWLQCQPSLQKARKILLNPYHFSPDIQYLTHLLKHFSSALQYKTSCFLSVSRYEE